MTASRGRCAALDRRIESARVDLMAHHTGVVFDPAIAQPEELVQAIRGADYVGRPVLAAVHPLADHAETDLLRMAAAAKERSNHPLAHAIFEHARGLGLVRPAPADAQIIPAAV